MNALPPPSRATVPGRIPAGRDSRPVDTAHLTVLAVVVMITGAAATLAWLLAAVVHLSELTVVLTVMAVAFAASWTRTNRRPANHHRVTLVPVRVRTY